MTFSASADDEYIVLNLQDIIDEKGSDFAVDCLNRYYCPLDSDIESFARTKAIDFSEQAIARTYLVFQGGPTRLVGMIALAQKSLSIPLASLRGKRRTLLRRFGKHNEQTNSYDIPLILIAQLGKNYRSGMNELITGNQLLSIACKIVQQAQRLIGGKLAFLECKPEAKLIDFYARNGFVQFTPDQPYGDNSLIQMIKHL